MLKSKYLKNQKDWPTNKKASHTWRNIIKARDFTVKNRRWIVGNNKEISCHYWWRGDTSLAESKHVTNIDQGFYHREQSLGLSPSYALGTNILVSSPIISFLGELKWRPALVWLTSLLLMITGTGSGTSRFLQNFRDYFVLACMARSL